MQHLYAAVDTETPLFALSFRKSRSRPHDNSIVSALVYDPSLLVLGVQSIHLQGCQASGYGDRSGSGDAFSQSWNPNRRQDVVQFLSWSAFYLYQWEDTVQLWKDFCKRVTVPILLFVQRKLLCQGFRDLLCSFTGMELTENILVTRKLLQINLHVLHRGRSMVPVLCHKANMHKVLDTQQGFCEGNALACRRAWNSRRENWNNHMAECIQLLPTPFRHLAIRLVASSESRIWSHHHPVLVEFVDPGILFEEEHYPVPQMLKKTEIDGKKNVGYDNCRWRDVLYLPEDAFWGFNLVIFQILSCFPALCLISLSCKYHFLEV